MKKSLHIASRLTAIIVAFAAFAACSGNMSPESIEETLRQAESAIAKGDMTVASSVAANIADSTSVGNMSVSQIGRLSMVYMQLADSIDQSANTETATDLYDRAFRVNADSARQFYNSIEPEHMQFVETMTGNSIARRNPIDINSLPADSDFNDDFFQDFQEQ